MVLITFLFFAVKSDPSIDFEHVYNQSIECASTFSFSNSLFIQINNLFEDQCELKSISFSYCSFSQIGCIINNGVLNNFTFDHNCCYNGVNSDQSFIKVSSQSCQLQWNTFSTFSRERDLNFICFLSPKVQITNLNLTKCNFLSTAVSIQLQSKELQFNDITFDNLISRYHIHITGSSEQYYIDRINDNGRADNYFIQIEKSQFIITRVYMPNNMRISVSGGFIWFVDSYMPNSPYQLVGNTVPHYGAIVIDSMNTLTSSYFINQLSLHECQTNNIVLSYLPNTVASSMKVKIAFSFIGGALFGVVVFLIIYFTVKYSIKCYQKKKDKEHPVFDL